MPKPVLTILELSFPLASSDLGANSLENEFMTKKLHLSQVHHVPFPNLKTASVCALAV
jgi:chromosome transmission fidelity protein 4